jgi:hypothetical protein
VSAVGYQGEQILVTASGVEYISGFVGRNGKGGMKLLCLCWFLLFLSLSVCLSVWSVELKTSIRMT